MWVFNWRMRLRPGYLLAEQERRLCLAGRLMGPWATGQALQKTRLAVWADWRCEAATMQ